MLSEAKHPATSTHWGRVYLENATEDLSCPVIARVIEVAGFFASLRMTVGRIVEKFCPKPTRSFVVSPKSHINRKEKHEQVREETSSKHRLV
jgi:hypothetical protein